MLALASCPRSSVAFPGTINLRNKLHVVGVATAYVVEQVPYLSSTAVLIEDRGGRLQERVVG